MHAEAIFYNKMAGHFRHLTLAVSRRATSDVLEPPTALGAVGSSALFGGG